MKINEYSKEIQDKCDFACLVCLEKINSTRIGLPKLKSCNCRVILNEYCPNLENVLKEMEK